LLVRILFLLAVLPSFARAQTGTLFLVGGGPQPPALVEEFVTLAGGPGKARIVVLAMASASGQESGQTKAEQLKGLGAHAINVYVDRRQADTDSVVHLLRDATGIWFGGGLQSRLADVLVGTRTSEAIHARYRAGAVVGGTSAGAAIMSTPMITGSEMRRGGDRYPADSSLIFITVDRKNVETAPGLGLITTAIIDQHFLRRKRHNRLISLVLEGPVRLGAGIDESTALVIEPDGSWRVSGASSVVVYDARRATVSAPSAPLGGSNVQMHVLSAGGRFDPVSGKATVPQ
jgi:cyanophycinase